MRNYNLNVVETAVKEVHSIETAKKRGLGKTNSELTVNSEKMWTLQNKQQK